MSGLQVLPSPTLDFWTIRRHLVVRIRATGFSSPDQRLTAQLPVQSRRLFFPAYFIPVCSRSLSGIT
jgi:hypothetical protein